jgi:AraC family transcriptional regulator of arabinose operon
VEKGRDIRINLNRLPKPFVFVVMMDRRVLAVINYMLEDLTQPLRLEELAHSVNLSASRLQHLFKADTNMTAAQYLRFLRMERARKLIESSFLTTKEIMHKVGIKDESHFVREFKKFYGLPPASYRRSLPTFRIMEQIRPINS